MFKYKQTICMYKLIYVIEFLLQSSFRNPTELYYNLIVILYDVWRLCSIYVFFYLCILKNSTSNGVI
jgi:hypothetical protein